MHAMIQPQVFLFITALLTILKIGNNLNGHEWRNGTIKNKVYNEILFLSPMCDTKTLVSKGKC